MRVWLEATDISHEAFSLVLDSLPYTLGPQGRDTKKRDSGDDSTRAPPLPIPNREVKPCNADGTAKAGEQVIAVLEKKSCLLGSSFYLGLIRHKPRWLKPTACRRRQTKAGRMGIIRD